MDRKQTGRAGFELARVRCCVATLAAGAVLAGAVCVPSASAGLVEEAANTVGSTVKSVQETANVVPSLPGPTPPATPSPPPATATPSPPRQVPVKPPSKEPPAPAPRAGDDAADPPLVDEVAGAAQKAADSMTSAANDTASRAATTPVRRDDGPVAVPQDHADRAASEAVVRGSRTASNPPVAVRAAEVAALKRWLARVWPAVSLGGSEVRGAGVVEGIAGGLLRPALTAVTGLLLASSPVLQTSGDSPLSGHQGVAGASRSAPNPALAPTLAERGSFLYLIAIGGLLALLGFTVWREFRLALHPRLR